MLDAIVCPEWEYRYFSFNSKWGPNEEMASMRDGCGDEWFLLFDRVGAALKGLAHELASDGSFPARIQELVPRDFVSFLREPAFDMEHATFCLWRRTADREWSVVQPRSGKVSPEADGSGDLLAMLDGRPQTYHSWAKDYYEISIPVEAVRAIYEHQPLTEQLVTQLNPDLSLAEIQQDVVEIAYPNAALGK
jgi:hypothetical protein